MSKKGNPAMTIGNALARAACRRRNLRNPRQSRREKDWLQKFRQGLLARGIPMDYVLGIDPPVELDCDPDDCAAEEAWCMAQDAEPLPIP